MSSFNYKCRKANICVWFRRLDQVSWSGFNCFDYVAASTQNQYLVILCSVLPVHFVKRICLPSDFRMFTKEICSRWEVRKKWVEAYPPNRSDVSTKVDILNLSFSFCLHIFSPTCSNIMFFMWKVVFSPTVLFRVFQNRKDVWSNVLSTV